MKTEILSIRVKVVGAFFCKIINNRENFAKKTVSCATADLTRSERGDSEKKEVSSRLLEDTGYVTTYIEYVIGRQLMKKLEDKSGLRMVQLLSRTKPRQN